ncbi:MULTISPECIES: pyroglutamyl peptidase [Kytococcus]|uniref:pyroglutamyl peptidase n=1 Tax=Kytococcus TaxID=57499 RepID=UPI0009F23CD2|nr:MULTISPECIES: pyroglutamyl peptidase [Kytococcus]
MSRPTRAVAVLTAAVTLTTLSGGPSQSRPLAEATSTAPTLPASPCADGDVPLTPEEAFLARPEAAALVAGGGFGDQVASFQRALCAAPDAEAAEQVVQEHGAALWELAVDRAQGRVDTGGWLSAGDDRPLYWARLAMVASIRQHAGSAHLSAAQRQDLVDRLDRVSRGQEDVHFPKGRGVKRVLVTGFDPFTLDEDVRQANPSGAAALALDGLTVAGPDGPVRIEAAMLPVRWRDFDHGMVEDTLLPHFTTGRDGIDAFTTVSQGRPGQFDLEVTNGAWRAGFHDNEFVCHRGQVPAPQSPTVTPQPQWTRSTLPMDALTARPSGPFPVVRNTEVTEVPGDTPPEPVTTTCPAPKSPGTVRPDGPTEGSQARAGGGGNYLSNEVAYRATLLRDAVGLDVPGGHVHTPVLEGLPEDRTQLTSSQFEANREAITAQVRELVVRTARSTR